MKWKEQYRINANDTDINNIVSVSNILRYMQDTANRQMEMMKPSYDELIERGLAFILSRIRISIYSPLYSHDNIDVESWACESRGVTFNRCYRILKGGNIIAEASSCWALAGVNDRKLHRVNEIELGYGSDEMLELDMPSRFRIPDSVKMNLVGERVVEYADTDINGHMNNTRYPDLLCGWSSDMKNKRAVSMAISFVSEAPVGCTLKIYHGESDGVHYIRTLKDSGATNVEAEIIFDNI